ncbi:MAG: CRISPR-associated endoribonuclease Cas6, partial [Thermoplasmata archaeon]
MRMLVNLTSNLFIPLDYFNKYYFQSAIYSFLINTEFESIHNSKKFKFFTFSDYFPSGPLEKGKIKSIIISSPNENFIKTLYEKIEEKGYIYLLDKRMEIESLKLYKINWIPRSFETGSPIVLQKDSKMNKYFSFRDNGTITFFLK